MVNYLELVIGNIVSRKKRNFLTIIAIVIGVCAVVSLFSLGVGLQVTISEQFEMMGTDKLMITPGGSFLLPPGTRFVLPTKSRAALKLPVPPTRLRILVAPVSVCFLLSSTCTKFADAPRLLILPGSSAFFPAPRMKS